MKKDLIYYGGCGYDGLSEQGRYVVKYNREPEEEDGEMIETWFGSLTEARDFFDSLEVQKSLWSFNDIPELIDCYV